MARHLVALLLCALAVSASAFSHERIPAMQFPEESSLDLNEVLVGFEMLAQQMEKEVESLLAEAEHHHSKAILNAQLRGNIFECTAQEFNDVVAISGRVLDVIYKVRIIIREVPSEFQKCSGWNFLWCQAQVIQGAIKKVLDLKDEGLNLIGEVQQAVKNFNNCLKPAPTSAPTAAPTEAPTAAPTEAPTAAPTDAPTAAPETEAPAPETEAPAPETQAPSRRYFRQRKTIFLH